MQTPLSALPTTTTNPLSPTTQCVGPVPPTSASPLLMPPTSIYQPRWPAEQLPQWNPTPAAPAHGLPVVTATQQQPFLMQVEGCPPSAPSFHQGLADTALSSKAQRKHEKLARKLLKKQRKYEKRQQAMLLERGCMGSYAMPGYPTTPMTGGCYGNASMYPQPPCSLDAALPNLMVAGQAAPWRDKEHIKQAYVTSKLEEKRAKHQLKTAKKLAKAQAKLEHKAEKKMKKLQRKQHEAYDLPYVQPTLVDGYVYHQQALLGAMPYRASENWPVLPNQTVMQATCETSTCCALSAPPMSTTAPGSHYEIVTTTRTTTTLVPAPTTGVIIPEPTCGGQLPAGPIIQEALSDSDSDSDSDSSSSDGEASCSNLACNAPCIGTLPCENDDGFVHLGSTSSGDQ